MARRTGMRPRALGQVEEIVRRERANRSDVYAPLGALRLDVADATGAIEDRFRAVLHDGGGEHRLRMTPTALRQLCAIAGLPAPVLERLPTALGLRNLRCLLDLSEASDGRRYLFRLRGARRPRLRAVLPQGHVRFDDLDVLADLRGVAGDRPLRVSSLHVSEDILFLRLLFPDALNLGSSRHPDPAHCGLDVISSETGVRPLELRHVVERLVCSNGLTAVASSGSLLRRSHRGVRRQALREALCSGLDEALARGAHVSRSLANTRGRYIRELAAEMDSIFRRYRLGSPAGRIGRWVTAEIAPRATMFGVERFELIQAFTAVARGLDHPDRIRVEDAMGAYLLEETGPSEGRVTTDDTTDRSAA